MSEKTARGRREKKKKRSDRGKDKPYVIFFFFSKSSGEPRKKNKTPVRSGLMFLEKKKASTRQITNLDHQMRYIKMPFRHK